MEGKILTLLNQQEVLLSIGRTSKEFCAMARSDVVWKAICARHGTSKSKVYKKIMENSESHLEGDKWEFFRAHFRAFEEASDSENALESFKRLRRGYLRRIQDNNLSLQCFHCNREQQETIHRIISVCIHPSCDTVKCLVHYDSQRQAMEVWRLIKCHGCRLQECWNERHHASKIIKTCSVCRKTYCLDCRSFEDILRDGRLRSCCCTCASRIKNLDEAARHEVLQANGDHRDDRDPLDSPC